DVRNFTSISESMTAHELTRFINGLLTPLSDVILKHRGTIDKYMGDAIMAFWNAPLDDPDHAGHAAEAALEMVALMPGLNARWRKEAEAAGRTFADVRIGIGLNSGSCCVGNLGSVRRFDYSAIGDGRAPATAAHPRTRPHPGEGAQAPDPHLHHARRARRRAGGA